MTVSGPIFPIPPAFQDDGGFDSAAVRRYCEYLRDAGVTSAMTTAGTSGFARIGGDAISLAQEVAGAFGEAAVIGVPAGSVLKTLRWMRTFSEVHPAKAFLVQYPERYYDDATMQDYFREIADESPLPIWVHVQPLRDGHADPYSYVAWPKAVLSGLHERVTGIKEECSDWLAQWSLGQDWTTCVAGGSMRRAAKLDARCWLSGVGSLFPALELAPNPEAERRCFEVAFPMGWHRFLREALKQLDLLPAYEAAPWPRVTAVEAARIAALIEEIRP